MNQQRYRVVYNRTRNCFMAVAETITSQSKSGRETRATSAFPNHDPNHRWLKISFTSIAWASYLFLNPTLHAQIISDPNAPGHQQATVGITANKIPQIDIQTPNAAGLSHNVYQQFNVPQSGVIFNNSREEVKTELGGMINRNPHLISSGPANTILNEVRSSDPSVLRGFMEVAGQSAHVIVANPSGITCNGCGFINAHRSTLTTGVPQLDGSGNLEKYRITTGTIQIFGKGLNDEKSHYTDILARAIHINAKVHTKKLTLIAGANDIPVKAPAQRNGSQSETHLGEPHPLAANPANRPAFAIDISELGFIYANKAWLIGTEAGLGIHTAKHSEFAVGTFYVNTAGDVLHRGTITAQENATIIAAQGILNEAGAKIITNGDLSMRTKASIENKGLLAAKGNVDLMADGIASNIYSYAGSQILAGVDENDAILNPTSQIRVRATQKAFFNGKHTASGDLIINSQTIDLRGSETTATHISLLGLDDQAADNIDTTNATLTARNALTARALYRLTTNGATIDARDFFLSAYEWFNIGGKLTQTSNNDWLMTFLGNVNNTGATIKTNARHFSITAANIDNTRSTIDHQGTGDVSFTTNYLQSQFSKITTANTFKINADQVIFDNATIEVGQIDLIARLFSNRSGSLKLIGTAPQLFNISGLFDNTQGRLQTNGALVSNTGEFNNSYGYIFANGSINAHAGFFNNQHGRLLSQSHLSLTNLGLNNTDGHIIGHQLNINTQGNKLDNTRGRLLATASLNIKSGELLNESGTTITDSALDILSLALNNRRGLIRAKSLSINTQGHQLINSDTEGTEIKGGIISHGTLTLNTGAFDNQQGRIYANGLFKANTAYFDNRYGVINTDTQALFNSLGFNNQHGIVSILGDLTFNLQQSALDNDDGVIESNGKLSLTGGQINNRRGKLFSTQTLDIKSLAFNNQSGLIKSAQAITINTQGQAFINTDSGTEGGIQSNGSLTIEAGEFNNRYGKLISKGTLDILSGLFNNEGGLVKSSLAMTINTQGQNFINTHSGTDGGIVGEQSVTFTTGGFDNRHGYIESHKNFTFTGTHFLNRSGRVHVFSDAQFNAQSMDNLSGWIHVKQILNLLLGNGSLDNSAGLIKAHTLTIEASTLKNIDSNQPDQGLRAHTLDLNIHDIDNTRGLIHANYSLMLHGREHVNNTHGKISAGEILRIADTPPSRSRRAHSSVARNTRKAQRITNTDGTLYAGRQFTLDSASLSNDGQLRTMGDMTIAIHGDYTNIGNMSASGAMSFTTDGTFTNQALFNAATNLTLNAANLDNQLLGEISAGNTLTLNIANLFTNRGLVDAPTALIKASTLNNIGTGRIYGDHLSLAVNTLNNLAETNNGSTQAGTIAARQRLDLAASTINNRDKALIFSQGDMAIGGTLDTNNQAIGQADTVNNHAATIEALGHLQLGATTLNNTNGGVITETQTETDAQPTIEYRIDYETQNRPEHTFAPQGTVLPCNPSAAPFGFYDIPCGRPARLGYVKVHPERFGKRDYFKPIYPYEKYGALANTLPEQPSYQPDAATYARFDIPMPTADASAKQKDDALLALHKAITAYNAGVQEDYRLGNEGHYYQYQTTKTHSKTIVKQSNPGIIRSGGDMTFSGNALTNDKSTIVAGGALRGDHKKINNIDLIGTDTTHAKITTRYFYKKGSGSAGFASAPSTNDAAPIEQTINLKLHKLEEHKKQSGAPSGIHTFTAHQTHTAPPAPDAPEDISAPQTRAQQQGTNNPHSEHHLSHQGGIAPASAVSNNSPNHAPPTPQALLQASPREAIRTVEPNISLPTASLYKINTDSSPNRPLIETDPRFTNQQQWLGSQALMTAGTIDPNITQKRLSDNFYEQQLIREQVAQLTGRRFLNGYQNDNAQYQALINNGVSVAQTFQLTPGIALTHEQIARLTTDIVWLVEKTITLDDGSQTKALVPQVYVKVQKGDLKGDGSLISGDSVQFQNAEEFNNSGTVAGRTLVDISADNINNNLGTITAADGHLSALIDINNQGGTMAFDNSLSLLAGRDINVESTTQSTTTENGSSSPNTATPSSTRTHLDRVAGIYVGRNPGDTSNSATSLLAQAGRNLNFIGADVANHTNTSSRFTAGNNINLETVQTESQQTLSTKDKEHRHQETTIKKQQIGTQLNTTGDITFQAGQDITAIAANINSTEGAIDLNAGNDIVLKNGEQFHQFDATRQSDSRSFLGSKQETHFDSVTSTQATGSTVSGKTVAATAGNHIQLKGSNVVSDQNTALDAGNDVHLEDAKNTLSESHFQEEKRSGLMGSGGIGFTIGSKQQSLARQLKESTSSASTVGATDGNVNITAGKNYRQIGSDVIAFSSDNTQGDVNVTAQKIDIIAAENNASTRTEEKMKQSGLTVAVTTPMVEAIQNIDKMRQASEDTKDSRMKALAGAAAALTAGNAAAQVVQNPQKAASVGINASLGSSQSESLTTETATTQTASSVNAAGNVKLKASGADTSTGQSSDINVIGSKVKAKKNVDVEADHDVNFLSAQNTSEQHSTNKSSSASVGVGFNVGGGKTGFTVSLNVAQGKGKADGKEVAHTHTEVEAGETLNIKTKNDFNLRGGTAKGKKVTADIGNDLNIESVQDTSTYHSEQKNVSAGVSIPIGAGQGSASFNMSKSKVDNNYASVTQQSGLKAGDEGFQIKVKRNTDLKGGLIASNNKAIENDKNKLETGTLTSIDLNNKAEYEASSMSIGLGTSVTPGISNPAGIGFGNDSDKQASTTKASISQANIKITNEEKQKELTGKDAEQTIAELNREANTDKDTSGALQNKFDANTVQKEIDAQTAITQTFGQQAAQAVGTFAQSKQIELIKQANQDGTSADQRKALLEEASKWGEGGRYRVAMHVVTGGLTGNIAGAAAAGVIASAAPTMNELQKQIKTSLKDAGASENAAEVASKLIMQTAVAGAGAVVGGATGNATAGAAVGLNIDSNNRQLHSLEEKYIKENVKAFAEKENITEQQAVERLTQQALRQTDYLWRAQLSDGDDTAAQAFLAKAQQTFTNDLGHDQKLFTTEGQQLFRPEMFADTANPSFYKQFAHSGISRSLGAGLLKEFKDSGIDIKNSAFDFAKTAKENPKLVLNAAWEAVKNLPQSIIDSFKETAFATGEGTAVAVHTSLADKLNAIYGNDISTAQKTLLAARIASALTATAGLAKAGGELGEATAKAVTKKLDDIAETKALEKAKVEGTLDNNFYRDGSITNPYNPDGISPGFGNKNALEITPQQAQALVKQNIPVNVKIIGHESADKLNAEVLIDNPHFKPPYLPGSQAVTFETKAPTDFVRVYVNQPGASKQADSWMMPASEIKGLSPEQIASKYALPQVPTHITDVKVPTGIQMRTTIAGDIKILNDKSIAGNGGGGGVQFEVLNPPKPEEMANWFINARPLK